MKWMPGGESEGIEDRRDESGAGGFHFGGIHIGKHEVIAACNTFGHS